MFRHIFSHTSFQSSTQDKKNVLLPVYTSMWPQHLGSVWCDLHPEWCNPNGIVINDLGLIEPQSMWSAGFLARYEFLLSECPEKTQKNLISCEALTCKIIWNGHSKCKMHHGSLQPYYLLSLTPTNTRQFHSSRGDCAASWWLKYSYLWSFVGASVMQDCNTKFRPPFMDLCNPLEQNCSRADNKDCSQTILPENTQNECHHILPCMTR